MLGVGAGYLAWGVPKDWYAGHDPAKLPASPENDLIRYGWDLVVNTPRFIGKTAEDPAKRFAGNDLACTNCHINAGLTALRGAVRVDLRDLSDDGRRHRRVAVRAPQRLHDAQHERLAAARGEPRDAGADRLYPLRRPKARRRACALPAWGWTPLPSPAQKPDAGNGEQVYAKACARCHGANGEGDPRTPPAVGYATPPLWGDKSFNAGAGMSKIEMAAAFIHANMPPGAAAELGADERPGRLGRRRLRHHAPAAAGTRRFAAATEQPVAVRLG